MRSIHSFDTPFTSGFSLSLSLSLAFMRRVLSVTFRRVFFCGCSPFPVVAGGAMIRRSSLFLHAGCHSIHLIFYTKKKEKYFLKKPTDPTTTRIGYHNVILIVFFLNEC